MTPTQDEIRQCADRLRASLRCDAMNGDAHERAVCAHQMRYAADLLSWLAQQEPVAWRWRPKGAETWIYDPKPDWLARQDDSIEKQPLYAAPVPAPKE